MAKLSNVMLALDEFVPTHGGQPTATYVSYILKHVEVEKQPI